MLTSLKRCRLVLDNLDALVMVCKNWPDDAHVDCLLTFIEKNVVDYLYLEDALLEGASRASVF
jgi:hypothetical protein